MNIWNWFKSKAIDYHEVFGELSAEAARSFYESYFQKSDYRTIDVSLPEEIRISTGYDFDVTEAFDFQSPPIKQPDHWILGSHIEFDTPTIIVGSDKKVMLLDVNIDGTYDRCYLAENFDSFLDYIVTKAD